MAVVLALRRYKPTPSLPGLMMSPRTWKLDKPCVSLTKWQRQSNSVLYRARPKQTSWQFTDLLAVLGPINFALISSVTEVSLPFSSLCQLCKWTEMKTLQFVLSLCCFSTRVLLCWTWAKSWAWWGIYGLFHASPTSENSPHHLSTVDFGVDGPEILQITILQTPDACFRVASGGRTLTSAASSY